MAQEKPFECVFLPQGSGLALPGPRTLDHHISAYTANVLETEII